MPASDTPASQPAKGAQAAPSAPLPSIRCGLSEQEVLERLGTASRRGRLAGFAARPAGATFAVAAHGSPFDSVLLAAVDAAAGRITFRLEMLKKVPVIFAVLLVATVWPGVLLMDSLIPGEWGWIPTWWWYVPLTVLPIPWAWRGAMKKSRASSHASALEMIKRIASELGGTVENPAAVDQARPG